MLRQWTAASGATVVLVVVLTGCSSPQTPAGSPSPSTVQTAIADGRCTNTGTVLVRLPSGNSEEPTLALPKPPGWTFSTENNSPSIRGTLSDTGLKADDFVPSFVVSLADVTGDASTPEQALDTERAGFAQTVGVIQTDTPGTLCRYPSKTITYTYERRQGTTLMVAAKDHHGKIWISKVSTETMEPNNPDFVKAKQVILRGFQFILPNVNH